MDQNVHSNNGFFIIDGASYADLTPEQRIHVTRRLAPCLGKPIVHRSKHLKQDLVTNVKDAGVPMLVTFNSHKSIEKVQKRIHLPHPTHTVSLRNLLIMTMVRYMQGKNGMYYCGTFTTPEGGHDLSFMSGLVVAHAVGAPYPFGAEYREAAADFRLMQKMMLKRSARSA